MLLQYTMWSKAVGNKRPYHAACRLRQRHLAAYAGHGHMPAFLFAVLLPAGKK